MTHSMHGLHGGGMFRGVFFGLLIAGIGALSLLSLIGRDYGVPADILHYGAAAGSIIGGLYMIFRTIFKHRIILS